MVFFYTNENIIFCGFFYCFNFIVLILLLTVFMPLMSLLSNITHSVSWLLLWYVPSKLAKFYTEYEPQGKQMHIYIIDYVVYLKDFVFDKRAIYQEERVEICDEIVFEKTKI